MKLSLLDELDRVSVVGHVAKVADQRRIDFFILGSHEQASDANELVVFPFDLLQLGKSVQEIYGDEQSLGQ